MLPVIPQQVNRLIQDNKGQLSTFPFPPNIAGLLSKEQRQKLFLWMYTNQVWPQIQERKPFESIWDKMLMMAKASWKFSDTDIDEGTRLERKRQSIILDSTGNPYAEQEGSSSLCDRVKVADTVVYDAIDRLTNLSHFIKFKEKTPVRYEIPAYQEFPYDNDVYSPISSLVNSANGWLRFNQENEDVYRKDIANSRHHYTYGCSFVCSEYHQKIEVIPRRIGQQFQNIPELTEIGITFEPLSIRKLWLNWRIPIYKMEHQPCPFFFETMPRFALDANAYHPQMNPMGFANLDSLRAHKGNTNYLFSSEETSSLETAFKIAFPKGSATMTNLLSPEYSTELLWTFYPMLPLMITPVPPSEDNPNGVQIDIETMTDPKTQESIPVPMKRYIMQSFGTSLATGQQEIVKLQENFYPHNKIPIYGSSHMPSLDDGVYTSAIGTILEGHYTQLCKALLQYLENKDWCNDPPVEIMHNSPALTKDINRRGERIPVNSQNDIKRREPFDGTQTTVQFMEYVRNQAKTSSKATEAIVGQAMGSRTSATEATNVFQTAMSGVTTDVNLYTHDIHGEYAGRVWEYTGRWVDPDLLAEVTGSYGFAIKPEHLLIRMGVVWDSGSQYIESITRQQQLQWMLQAFPPGSTEVNRAYLAEELLIEQRFKNVRRMVNDQGREQQVQQANEEACRLYLGDMVMVDPDQDHNVALKVLSSYLKDYKSYWNTNPDTVINSPALVKQMQMHVYFLQLQMLQQKLQEQQMLMMGQPDVLHPMQSDNPSQPASQSGTTPSARAMVSTGGQRRQQTGK